MKTIEPETLKSFYETMLRIRIFEERVAELVVEKKIRCPAHLYIGQEAIATGVCAALKTQDYIFGTHRSHGHYLAKGGTMRPAMAEMFGKITGCSKGRGGSMHLVAKEIGILGTSPIVAASLPLAAGAAFASQYRGDGRVSVVFFGDGAVEEGVFHETLNFAALYKLPVIFVCENNFYSSHLPLEDRQPLDNIFARAESYGIPGYRIDGNDVCAVYESADQAAARARSGLGPTLIEGRTYRWRGHVGANWDLELGIRDKATLEKWMERCPIKTLESKMKELGIWNDAESERWSEQAKFDTEDSVRFAEESPYPEEKDLALYVFRE